MKYKLFDGWWKRYYCGCAFMIFAIAGIVLRAVWFGNTSELALWGVGLGCVYGAILLSAIFAQRRLLTYVIAEPNVFSAYSHGHRKLCSIDRRKSIYYACFSTPASGCGPIPLIALSNNLFVYSDYLGSITARKRFIQGYDWKKIVLMPYNEQTMPLLSLDKWQCVQMHDSEM